MLGSNRKQGYAKKALPVMHRDHARQQQADRSYLTTGDGTVQKIDLTQF